jgi:hypothetical protein
MADPKLNDDLMRERPSRVERSLDDLNLTADTAMDQIVAAWGQPELVGPGRTMAAYRLSGQSPRREIWLSFTPDEPRLLTRALLLIWHNEASPEVSVLLNRIDVTRARRWDQLDFSHPVTADEVQAVWGPPDGVAGLMELNWLYTMANGETAFLTFAGGRVADAVLPGRPCNRDAAE